MVVALNGRPIHIASELRARLGLTPIGDEVEMRINRGGTERVLRVRIAAPQEYAPGKGQTIPQLAGLQVVEIERGSPLYQRLRGGALLVAAVDAGSRAYQAGFRPGDIVYAVNRRRVQTLPEFQAALQGTQRGFAISLLRGDFNLTITVR